MCSPAIAVVALTAAATVGSAVSQNQAAQHAKGAAEAQQQQADVQTAKTGPPQSMDKTPSSDPQAAAATQARRAAAMRAGIMSTIGPNMGSTGNTTPTQPMAFVSGQGKKLLGQ